MKNIKNSTLLIIFGILALIVLLFFFYDHKKGERSFRSDLFTIDSARVSKLTIYPKDRNKQILILSGSGKEWKITRGNKSWPADTGMLRHIITSLLNAKPERVAGDKSSWKEFQLTDSASVRVVVEQGKDIVADFRVGKISFSQDSRGNFGRQGVSVKSHIRVAGDDKVYVVDGFLSMIFRDEASAYRNKLISRFDRNQVNRLTFNYPGDSSFVLQKQDNLWTVNGKPADSARSMSYLNSLANLFNSEFAEDGEIPVTYSHNLKIEGTTIPSIEIQGLADEGAKRFFVKSNMNTSAVFGGANPALFRQVFLGKGKFEKVPQKNKPGKKK